MDETPRARLRGLRPGPETHAVISWSRGRTKVRLGRWIRTGWVLYVSTCVKLDVTCAVCSVSRIETLYLLSEKNGFKHRFTYKLNEIFIKKILV